MKTNDRITLVYGEYQKRYNPFTGEYEDFGEYQEKEFACFLNFVSKAQLMKEYGTVNERIMIVRFNRRVEPFNYALYKGEKYEVEDGKDIPIKGAVRLKRVQA